MPQVDDCKKARLTGPFLCNRKPRKPIGPKRKRPAIDLYVFCEQGRDLHRTIERDRVF